MANGGIQQLLGEMGAIVRVEESTLTPDEATEYGGWKRLGMSLGHFADCLPRKSFIETLACRWLGTQHHLT